MNINKENISLMFSAIKCYLNNEPLEKDITKQELDDVFELSDSHDISHLIGVAIEKTFGTEDKERFGLFFDAELRAFYKYTGQEHARLEIYKCFESEGISYMPLKGAVICGFYPEPWHRTSCDIDILVKQSELDRAVCALEKQLNYITVKKSGHDISFASPIGIHVELHYDLQEKQISAEQIWENAQLDENTKFKYKMPAEMFILCHIAHMAKHFIIGGCGVRPFLDLHFIIKKMKYDKSELNEILCGAGLSQFAQAAFELADVWFGTARHTSQTQAVSDYILGAGTYGNMENRVAVVRSRKKSKFSYFLSRAFPLCNDLRYVYPVLAKHRWLYPFCNAHRLVKLLFTGKSNKFKMENQLNDNLNAESIEKTKSMLKSLNLQ